MVNRVKLLVVTLLLSLPAAAAPITIFIAGDSTAANKQADKRPETGWGEALQQYFDPAQVKIDNRAKNGRSTKSFIAEGSWDRLLQDVKAGDFVLIQFGHNDESKDKAERYTPPDDFKANLQRMVRDVRAQQATPVLLTPVSRRKFDATGAVVDTHGVYPGLVRTVATEENAPLIDMHEKTAAILTEYGDEKSRQLFLQLKAGENPNYPNGIEDNTHFSPLGAELVAKAAVAAFRAAQLGFARYLKDAGH